MKKTLFVCTPSGSQVSWPFFDSFTKCAAPLMLAYHAAFLSVASSLIVENRNELVRRLLAFEAQNPLKIDYVLWIDNDIVFSFEQIQKLLAHLDAGKDFVSGVYFSVKGEQEYPVAYVREGERYAPVALKDSGLREVDAVGFGFAAMKMELVRKLFSAHAPRPFDLRYLADGSVVTEDFVFCERAKAAGYSVWLDDSLIVKHVKGMLPGRR
ncbi:MAG: glycosyltransferase [Candidatus Diapherotrites archaeon]|nr:glycosyltransferase [Candidatus Diapherotrites archaeon]